MGIYQRWTMYSIDQTSNCFHLVERRRSDAFLAILCCCISPQCILSLQTLAFLVLLISSRSHRVFASSNPNHRGIEAKLIVWDHQSRNQSTEECHPRSVIQSELTSPSSLIFFTLLRHSSKPEKTKITTRRRSDKTILLYGNEVECDDPSLFVDFFGEWGLIFTKKQTAKLQWTNSGNQRTWDWIQ